MMKNLASWNNLASITYLWIALRSKSSGTNLIENKGPPESPGQVPELEPGTLAQNIEGSLNFLGRSFSTCSYSASNDWRLYRSIDIKRTHFICITVFLILLHTPRFLLEIRIIIKISSHPWYNIKFETQNRIATKDKRCESQKNMAPYFGLINDRMSALDIYWPVYSRTEFVILSSEGFCC